jgi:type II secretory pathway component PulK
MRNESGVAMLMALVTMVLLSILAGEMVYQSGVYSSVVFRQRDQLRATLLARSALRLALLQVKAAKLAKAKAKSMGLGEDTSVVDKIWQTPLILPPPAPPGLSPADTGAIDGFRKELGFDGSLSVSIIGESSRVSVTQLLWPFGGAAPEGAEGTAAANDARGGVVMDPNNPTATVAPGSTTGKGGMTPEQKKTQLDKQRKDFAELLGTLLEKKRLNDDAFREKYPSLTGETLSGNLLAWMDPETKMDGDNREKNDYYQGLEPSPYAIKNAPLASESEYHMIKGFDETIAKLLADNFTAQSTNSLDVNKASMLLIHSLIPDLTPDALDRIDKRRKDDALGGNFKDAKDFWNFVKTLGRYDDAEAKLKARNIKILDTETAYRVVITAQSGSASKTWLANIASLPPVIDSPSPQAAAAQAAAAKAQQPQQPPGADDGKAAKGPAGTEASDTDSLNIVYLKAD